MSARKWRPSAQPVTTTKSVMRAAEDRNWKRKNVPTVTPDEEAEAYLRGWRFRDNDEGATFSTKDWTGKQLNDKDRKLLINAWIRGAGDRATRDGGAE